MNDMYKFLYRLSELIFEIFGYLKQFVDEFVSVW